jgi:hypothetical protein
MLSFALHFFDFLFETSPDGIKQRESTQNQMVLQALPGSIFFAFKLDRSKLFALKTKREAT